MNIDGFPDFFLTLEFKAGSSKRRQSFVLLNVACTAERCPAEAASHKDYDLDLPRRYFEATFEEGFDSRKITSLAGSNTELLVPMDIDDDGRIDAVVQRCE